MFTLNMQVAKQELVETLERLLDLEDSSIDFAAELEKGRNLGNSAYLYKYIDLIGLFLQPNVKDGTTMLLSFDEKYRTLSLLISLPVSYGSREGNKNHGASPIERYKSSAESVEKVKKLRHVFVTKQKFSYSTGEGLIEFGVVQPEDTFPTCSASSHEIFNVVDQPLGNESQECLGEQLSGDLVHNSDDQASAETDEDLEEEGINIGQTMGRIRLGLGDFEAGVRHIASRVTSGTKLPIKKALLNTLRKNPNDPALLPVLEETVQDWCSIISLVIDAENSRGIVNSGPLGEIEYWKERSLSFSRMTEQLQSSTLERILEILEPTDSEVLASFIYQVQELSRFDAEARDNVKFLTTLEHHLQILCDPDAQLATVEQILSNIFSALKTIWIISRHYNSDERMLGLLEKIGEEICSLVRRDIVLSALLQQDPEVSIRTLGVASKLLANWEQQYFQTREEIELSGADHRWEFDRRILFETTKYMNRVCGDIKYALTVLMEFSRFYGPELKSLTGDTDEISELSQSVGDLLLPWDAVEFDFFDHNHKDLWKELMKKFNDGVVQIEDRTESFIDRSFQKLRSSEAAFNLLEQFQTIKSRKSIQEKLMQKFDDIISQFDRELKDIWNIFNLHKDSPPILPNLPHTFGAIQWAGSLYMKAKRATLKFKRMEKHFADLPAWINATANYVSLSRQIRSFKNENTLRWRNQVHTISHQLGRPVLGPRLLDEHVVKMMLKQRDEEERKKLAPMPLKKRHGKKVRKGFAGSRSRQKSQRSALTANVSGFKAFDRHGSSRSNARAFGSSTFNEAMAPDPRIEQPNETARISHLSSYQKTDRIASPPFTISFSPALEALIHETRCFTRFDFHVPPIARTIQLQESKYRTLQRKLYSMVKSYSLAILQLKPHHLKLFKPCVDDLKKLLLDGFERINWNSMQAETFVADCDKKISHVRDIMSRLRKTTAVIDNVVEDINNTCLIDASGFP